MIVDPRPSFQLRVSLATTDAELSACKRLIAETYGREYGVRMAEKDADPNGMSELYPDRYAMGTIRGELVCCAGLYLGRTYVEEHGGILAEDVNQALADAGASWPRPRVEYTKIVVKQSHLRRGLGQLFVGATHSRSFPDIDGQPPAVLVCAKLSILRIWRLAGIRTRKLSGFVPYRNHDRYCAAGDPMESHLIIPEIDIHQRWYDQAFPATCAIDVLGGIHAD